MSIYNEHGAVSSRVARILGKAHSNLLKELRPYLNTLPLREVAQVLNVATSWAATGTSGYLLRRQVAARKARRAGTWIPGASRSGLWYPTVCAIDDDTWLEGYAQDSRNMAEVEAGKPMHGTRWNGWAKPSFTYEQALKVMEWINQYPTLDPSAPVQPPLFYYDKDKDAFVCGSEDDPNYYECYEGSEIELASGGKIKTYPIGAGTWIWDEAQEDELITIEGGS